jgi:hypothetical protein
MKMKKRRTRRRRRKIMREKGSKLVPEGEGRKAEDGGRQDEEEWNG